MSEILGAMGRRPAPDPVAQITKDMFDQRKFADGSFASSWTPKSSNDFFVDVEGDVVFDAVTAKHERRLRFHQELAAKGEDAAMQGTIQLRVIMDPLRTGFEEEKEFPIVRGAVVAGRFEIIELMGKATFSRAVRCRDLHQPYCDENGETCGYAEVCLKIINNTKEFFDQPLDKSRLPQTRATWFGASTATTQHGKTGD